MPLAAGQRGLITSELRVKKDLVELASQKFTCPHASTHIDFPEGDILNMHVTISLTRLFALSLRVPTNYPFRPPSVYCLTRVWHPNVCVDGGRVSHPLLDRDWKPVLSINTVIFGLQLLFLEPNPEHAANGAAARALLADRNGFAAQVRETMRGGTFLGYEFPRHCSMDRRRKRDRDDSDELMVPVERGLLTCAAPAKRSCVAMDLVARAAPHPPAGAALPPAPGLAPPPPGPRCAVRPYPVAPGGYPISLVPVEQRRA
ncbi:NEDD8 transferase [Aureococcus anophagefferens]|nr:NEDD8 transferase [Aureococcus anophagefferens]